MSKINTFDTDISTNINSLYSQSNQNEDIMKMRSSLLLANTSSDAHVVSTSLKNIAMLRITHQIGRVIKFIEYMDKIEDQMYKRIDSSINRLDSSALTLVELLKIQNVLLQNMTLSQKLLEPYMKMIDSAVEYSQSISSVEEIDESSKIIPKQSRDKIRITAQALLKDIDNMDNVS